MDLSAAQPITAKEDSTMNSIATVDQLKAMRFSAMAKELEDQMKDLESYRQLGFEEDGMLSYQWLMLPTNA